MPDGAVATSDPVVSRRTLARLLTTTAATAALTGGLLAGLPDEASAAAERRRRKKRRRRRKHHHRPPTTTAPPPPAPPSGPTSDPTSGPIGPITLQDADALHVLNRFTGGWTPALGAEVAAAGGIDAWFSAQLDPAGIPDTFYNASSSWWYSIRASTADLWSRDRA